MDLRDLHYFETIAELEHVGRAAKVLNRSQPTLTSCVRKLEEQYGLPLFEKAGRGIRLTGGGAALLNWARKLRLDAEGAASELSDIARGSAGHIRIGIVPTAARFLLPHVTRMLLAEAPNVTMKTVVALNYTLRPLLRAGELDLTVSTESTSEAGFVSKVVAQDAVVVAVNSQHPLLCRRGLKIRDLVGHKWVLQPPGAPTRQWLDHTFDQHGLPRPHVQIEANLLLLLPPLIAETGLLSFLSRQHLRPLQQEAGLEELPLRETTMRRRLVVTYRENGYFSAAAKRLQALLLQIGQTVFREGKSSKRGH